MSGIIDYRKGGNLFLKWNALMQQRTAAYVNSAAYKHIARSFPEIQVSNWDCHYNRDPFVCPDRNGYEYSRFSEGLHVGTHQAGNLYASVGHLRLYRFVKGRPRLVDQDLRFGHGPFQGFLFSVNRVRSMVLSSDVPVHPWIAHKAYESSDVRESDLYQELIFHAALSGPDRFVFWNPVHRRTPAPPATVTNDFQDGIVNDCLAQLTELAGAPDRRTLVHQLADWNADFVLSGMAVGGRSVWRFTPKLKKNEKRDNFLVARSPAKFRTRYAEIEIAGAVTQPRKVLSGDGYWIIAPADVRAQVTPHKSTAAVNAPQDGS